MTIIQLRETSRDYIAYAFVNTNRELSICALALRIDDKLIIEDIDFTTCGENNADLGDLIKKHLERVRTDPGRYEILTGHAHCRKLKRAVEVFDPYWTIGADEGLVPGSIVDGKFYVTRKGRSGDSGALQAIHNYLNPLFGINLNRTLFFHPAYGSEGKSMTRGLVSVTGYEFNESARFKVREIPVEII